VPMKAFEMPVKSVEEAAVLLWAFAQYDLFQYKNNVKPDYCNAGGLAVYEEGEWIEWENEDGEDINCVISVMHEEGRFNEV